MGLYDRYVLPPMLDLAMRQSPIMRQRAKVIPAARGRVLEVGLGSGLNLSFYDKSQVEHLYGLDPSAELTQRAEKRAAEAGIEVEVIPLGGEEIPLEDNSVDTVTMTYTLCTIPDGPKALGEIRRVLKPDGRLLFCEHGLAPDDSVAKWQGRITPVWKHIAGGCRLNVPIPSMIQQAGFGIDDLETIYLPGPRAMSFNYWGTAKPV